MINVLQIFGCFWLIKIEIETCLFKVVGNLTEQGYNSKRYGKRSLN